MIETYPAKKVNNSEVEENLKTEGLKFCIFLKKFLIGS